MKSFGEDLNDALRVKLKALRLKRGLSQERLAEIAGVSRSYITVFEQGKHHLTVDVAARLSVALGVHFSRLLKQIEDEGTPTGINEPLPQGAINKIMVKLTVGEVLKKCRRSRRLNQKAVSKKAGIESHRLSLIELDKVCPTIDELGSICEAMGVSPEAVMRRARKTYGRVKTK